MIPIVPIVDLHILITASITTASANVGTRTTLRPGLVYTFSQTSGLRAFVGVAASQVCCEYRVVQYCYEEWSEGGKTC